MIFAGYPACAGIDPMGVFANRLPVGLPRMRGDRPTCKVMRRSSGRATPHARGSTLHSHHWSLPSQGYPACAGIDRITDANIHWTLRLPRMRGDRPCAFSCGVVTNVATPHARGSTSVLLRRMISGLGYPACAGIDHIRSAPHRSVLRLPRMRGDRPFS